MEIKANYVLIGAFTILASLAGLGFFVWLADVQIDRRFAFYDILFESVSGLSPAAEVRYNGLPVGQVIDLRLVQDDPRVRVRIEVVEETPVRVDTVAQLQSQGVTGVSYVALTGGSADAPLLQATSDDLIPEIPSERSIVQALTEDAPDLVTEAITLLQRAQEFAGPENQERVARLLENLSSSSDELDSALEDFATISRTVAAGTEQFTQFTGRLDEIGSTFETTLLTLDATLETAQQTIAEAEGTMAAATDALNAAEGAFEAAGGAIETQAPQLGQDLSSAVRSVETAVETAMQELAAVGARFGTTADLADARLEELGATLAAVDQTLLDAQEAFEAVEVASDDFDAFVEEEGTPFVEEARATLALADATLARIDTALVAEVPSVVAGVQEALATANRVLEQAETSLAERVEPLASSAETALGAATDTLRRAETTLARLDTTLATADGALSAAESAFSGADRVLGSEIGPAMADLRSAAGQIETTMAELTADLPAIAEDLRQTASRARAVAEQVEGAVAATAPPVRDFATRGLPEFTQFAREAQDLVVLLERLVARIERDPARFFFGDSAPEFRR